RAAPSTSAWSSATTSSRSPSPTPGAGSRRRCCRTSSTPSGATTRERPTRTPASGSAWRSRVSSPRCTAEASPPTAPVATEARPSRCASPPQGSPARDEGPPLLVRVREHVLVPGCRTRRGSGARGGMARRLAPLPPRPDLRIAGVERLAVQRLPGEGPLHVARRRASLREARDRLAAAVAVSAERPARGARRVPRRRRAVVRRLRARGLPRELRRRSRDRGARGDRGSPRPGRRAGPPDDRASARARQQGAPAPADRGGGGARDLRRAVVHGRRRALLGKRSPRGRAGVRPNERKTGGPILKPYAARRTERSGSQTRNALPRPCSLSTLRRPPTASTSRYAT